MTAALRRRWPYFAATFVYVEALYAATNWQTFTAARLLPLSWVDRAAPFWPWTSWIYLTVYFLPLLACVAPCPDEDVPTIALAFALMDTFCTAVFIFYSTSYPRPALPADAGWMAAPMRLVQLLDTPRNCFPSQHVANAVLSGLVLQRYDRRAGLWALGLAALISFSTLTTKQHYSWDVLAGTAAAFAAYAWAVNRLRPSAIPASASGALEPAGAR